VRVAELARVLCREKVIPPGKVLGDLRMLHARDAGCDRRAAFLTDACHGHIGWMNPPTGPIEVYRVDAAPVFGIGVRFSASDFTDEFVVRLRDLHRLKIQKAELADLVMRSAGSEFATDRLRAALESGELSRENIVRRLDAVKLPEDDWRLGETLGREYLHRNDEYFFPVPASQDARNQSGSLPGTDYIGFRRSNHGSRFAFGEVKTSVKDARPPSVMYGSTGLVNQLVELLPDQRGVWDQILYLGTHAEGQPWQMEFADAYVALNADNMDFDVVGVLVRPRESHPDERKDLADRCTALASEIAGLKRGAILFAIYLPPASFKSLRTAWDAAP
jgi:hypothetical protein